ncbi:MAG: maleylpyruvate isomerase family mycothiol-dependent enzyme [Acidimicrobiales bacterium]
MPDTPSKEVIAAFEEIWSATTGVCESLQADAWELSTDCPGWTVRDHVSHMIGTELGLLGTPAPAPPEPMPGHVRNPIGQSNEAWIEARRGVPGSEVLAEFVDVTTRRLDQMRSFPPSRWIEPGWSPMGEVPYGEFMQIRIMDCWVHGQDIRWALDEPGDRGGSGERVALNRLTTGVGFIVGRQVGPPDGTTVVFEIEGPDPRTVAVAMEERRARSLDRAPAEPTVLVRLPALEFVRLACGRQSGEDALATGDVRFEGDEELGGRIASSMGFMI